MKREAVLEALGLGSEVSGAYAGGWLAGAGHVTESFEPATGELIGTVRDASAEEYETIVGVAEETFKEWRMLPAPVRGGYVREIGNALRKYKEPLGALVAMEMGKIQAEGEGPLAQLLDLVLVGDAVAAVLIEDAAASG